jgi:carboxymethylenebutenolidase
MGQWIPLDTAAGPTRGWLARPEQPPHGAVVLIQEIFGANAHIRSVAERLANAGYVALAPSMFDPVEAGFELNYDDAGMARGRALAASLGFEAALHIVRSASRWLREAGHHSAVVGFCWGGSVALLANTRLRMPAVSYYGGRSVPFLGEPLQAPMQFHFGADDPLIPPDDVQRHRLAYPDAALHVYDGAGHAFNRDSRPHDHHHHPQAAALAWQRTLGFLAEHTS